MTIAGNVAGAADMGVYCSAAGHAGIGITGNLSGGTTQGVRGALSGGGISVTNGNLIYTTAGIPGGNTLAWYPLATNYIQIGGSKYPAQLAAANVRNGTVHGDITGTLRPLSGGGALEGGMQ